jgi:hypothetical protein
VEVLGHDPAQPTSQWRARIGIVLQTCEPPPELTVWALVERFAGYSESESVDAAHDRADAVRHPALTKARMIRETFRHGASFEEVARLVTDFDLLAAPVVDATHGRVITRTTSWRSSCPSAGARRSRPGEPPA